ncbi:hypothetical protein JWH04_16415 [Xanthomonas melonis]|uniref:hypothetical protein n=1 Tax=Xanthomonas melonis TaxID=56456 RepID=UPI001E3C01AB|nr:hypothetical protein [Xanthomonas melonis]MCD0280495.1 hypothetical protein [Xanthomonas melonis]
MSDFKAAEAAHDQRIAGLSADDAMVHALSVIQNTARRDQLSAAQVLAFFEVGMIAAQVLRADLLSPANPAGEVADAASRQEAA